MALSFNNWLNATFKANALERASLIKYNYINVLQSELKTLDNELTKYRNKNIYTNSVIRKKLLKINPFFNFKLDLKNIGLSEESEENKLYD